MEIIHDEPLSRHLSNSHPNGNGTFPENSKVPCPVSALQAVESRHCLHRLWSQHLWPAGCTVPIATTHE